MSGIEQQSAVLATSVYSGSMHELTASVVSPPTEQARSIQEDLAPWLATQGREGFTPISYFFNTGQTPRYGAMFSANSGYRPMNPKDRQVLERQAKEGLDVIFYQCMSSFPAGVDAEAHAGLPAYETVAYWGGVMRSLEDNGYDVRTVIVDETSALLPDPALGLGNGGIQAAVSSLGNYLGEHGAEDRVIVRPMADMFTSPHAAILSEVDVEAMRTDKTEELRGWIARGEQTRLTILTRLLLGQLTVSGTQELGLDPYLGDNGVIPEELPLSALPPAAIGHIASQIVVFDTKMSLRNYLIEDAAVRGTDLPELGVPGRHVLRVGTTKNPTRPSVRLVPNGRDAKKRVVQVSHATPTYDADGSLGGFAKTTDVRSNRYGDAYARHQRIYTENGRLLALINQDAESL